MMQSLYRITFATSLVLSLGGTAVLADTPPLSSPETNPSEVLAQNPGGFRRRGRGRLMQQLNLTSQQQQALQDLRADYQNRISQRRDSLRQERQELGQMMAGTASERELRSQYQRVQELQEEMGNLHFESMLKTRSVLTPEQRRQFAELMQERRQSMQERRQNRGGFRR